MNLKRTIAGAGMALAMAFGLGGLAKADTYTLTTPPGCTTCGAGPFGTVTVTGSGTNVMDVTISLASGVFFNQAGTGGLLSVVFNLLGDPAVVISSIVNTAFAGDSCGTACFALAPGAAENAYSEDGVGTHAWDHAINWTGPLTDNSSLGVQTLSFVITAAPGTSLVLDPVNNGGVLDYFGVDIATTNCAGLSVCPATGAVGATLTAVPEPATWALLIAGIGFIGMALRRRARSQPAFA